MDLDSIFFIRTAAGEASIDNPAAAMSPAFRRMLRLLDGTHSLADLVPLFPQLDTDDLRMWISELLRQRMIKRAPSLTRSQRMRMRENAPAKEMQVQKIAEEIRPWLAGKKSLEVTGPRQRATQLTRTARMAAIEANTAAGSMGREGYFVAPDRDGAADGARTILVVEDDEVQARIISKFLEKDGHTVRVAHNGAAALLALQQVPAPQLVMLDIELPDMDGFSVLEQLRHDPATREMPVVMLTSLSDSASLAKGAILGANGYITKPFRPELLRMAIKRLLRAEAQ